MFSEIGSCSRDCDEGVHAAENVEDQEQSPGVPDPIPHSILNFTLRNLQNQVDRAVHRKHADDGQSGHHCIRIQEISDVSCEDSTLVQSNSDHAVTHSDPEQETRQQARSEKPKSQARRQAAEVILLRNSMETARKI